MMIDPKKVTVCLFDGVHENGIQVFRDAGFSDIRLFPNSLPEEELKKEIANAHIVGIRSKTKLPREILSEAKQLLCIGRYGIGVNNVDLSAAEELGIPVFNGPFSSTRAVAELVLGLIFALFRRIPERSVALHEGAWTKSATNCLEVRGKTLGLVGYGNIASQISVLAEAIGMHVLYSDVRAVLPLGNARQVSFEEVLANSDVISLHVPGLPSTENMMNATTLNMMKKGSYLINCSRGTVVNIADLKVALESGHLRGAALDVFPKEPKSKEEEFSCKLRGMPNVIFSPHVGGATEEAQAALGTEVSEKMKAYALFGDSSMALNFPQIIPGAIPEKAHRLLIIHKNEPGVLAQINDVIAEAKANISAQILKTKGKIGVVVIDTEKEVGTALSEKLSSLSPVLKCLILS